MDFASEEHEDEMSPDFMQYIGNSESYPFAVSSASPGTDDLQTIEGRRVIFLPRLCLRAEMIDTRSEAGDTSLPKKSDRSS
jgi:hypothetical protein